MCPEGNTLTQSQNCRDEYFYTEYIFILSILIKLGMLPCKLDSQIGDCSEPKGAKKA